MSKDDVIAQAEANWARQRAAENQKRKEQGLATVRLVQAEDEVPLLSTEVQGQLQHIKETLTDPGVPVEFSFLVMDSAGVDGGGGYIGELLIPFAQIFARPSPDRRSASAATWRSVGRRAC